MKTYIYHQDSSHGWIEVEKKEIEALNLQDKITSFSYQNYRG